MTLAIFRARRAASGARRSTDGLRVLGHGTAPLLLAAALVVAGCGTSDNDTAPLASVGDVTVGAAWIRPAPAGSATTALYMTISNEGDVRDVLESAEIEGCAMTELHMTTLEDDVMSMSPIPDGITLTPNASIVLGPGALHVMCIGVETGFSEGARATVELRFENAGALVAEAEVRRGE